MDRHSRSGPVGHCLLGHTVAVKLCKVNSSRIGHSGARVFGLALDMQWDYTQEICKLRMISGLVINELYLSSYCFVFSYGLYSKVPRDRRRQSDAETRAPAELQPSPSHHTPFVFPASFLYRLIPSHYNTSWISSSPNIRALPIRMSSTTSKNRRTSLRVSLLSR